jgi:DNA-directed RNA polymerase subunit RPC12/RpoP
MWGNGEVNASGNLKGFYRRNLSKTSGTMLDNGKPMWEYAKWNLISGVPKTDAEAAGRIASWTASGLAGIEFAVVRCVGCTLYHNQADWSGTLCPACSGKGIMKPKPLLKVKLQPVPIAQPMKNGEVRKLPQANSPVWTVQWSVMGTAKMPYIVSRTGHTNGATTSEGWACSCPNFTQHTPRTECKHILKVMMSEGVKPSAPPVAALPDEQQEAFQKFLRQQAAAKVPDGKARPLFTTGRRFR